MRLENINILIILHYGALGGAQRQALGLAKFLTEEKNCNVDLFLMHSDFQTNEFKEFSKKSKIRNIYHFGEPYLYLPYEISFRNLRRVKWNISYLLKIRKGLKMNNYRIIIPYLNHTSKLAYFIYKIIPSIKVTFWHQLGLDILKKDFIEKHVANNIPFVIGNASNCFDIFKNEYPLPEHKLNLLPQYLTLDVKKKDRNKILEQLKISSDTIIVGMIAHYRKDKYFNLLLDAFFEVEKKTNQSIHLILLGNKENDNASLLIYEKLVKKVKAYGLENKISVLSGIDVVDVLNVLDISVLVSQIEGMPNSVMEYMAYGLPAIVSNHPGCKQLLGNSGYLIPNDQTVLENKLEKLINNFEDRVNEGEINLKRIEKFNLPWYVSELENIISKYV